MDIQEYNCERLKRNFNLWMLSVGDFMVLAALDRVAMTLRWNPHKEVTWVYGPVVYVRNQLTGKHKAVNCDTVQLVNLTIALDEVNL